jgi:hypothetical protein
MEVLEIAGWNVAIDTDLLELAAGRCQLHPFRASNPSLPRLTLRTTSTMPADALVVALPDRARGEYAAHGDDLWARIDRDPYAAEVALRLAFHTVTLRQGGVLVHAAGIAFRDRAVVAVGASGAGKTTLARLSHEYGGARLMSDEIVALFPDGSVVATPFRSDQSLPIEAKRVRGVGVLALAHGASEIVEPTSGPSAASLIVSQAYRFRERDLTQGELLARVAGIVESMGSFRLTFRNHPEAGAYLRDWVLHGAATA